MNIDIQTEHVAMRPEWHREIDRWVARCARAHPALADVDVTLRHATRGADSGEEVDVVATAHGRTLRGAGHAALMSVALHDALGAVEQELLVDDAVHGARA